MGPRQEFVACGRQETCNIALGHHTKGFEKWKHPHLEVIVDGHKGKVVGFCRQIPPATRLDGNPCKVAGVSGLALEHSGNCQWKSERDFFDLGNVKQLFVELAGDGKLEGLICGEIHEQARGLALNVCILNQVFAQNHPTGGPCSTLLSGDKLPMALLCLCCKPLSLLSKRT